MGGARAGMGQLPAVSGDSAPQASSAGGGSRATHPSLGTHPAHHRALGCCCRGTCAGSRTQHRHLAGRHRETLVPQGWHHRRDRLSLSPTPRPLGFVSPGCARGRGLHVSPPARGWGAPSVPRPQLPGGIQGQRWGWDVEGDNWGGVGGGEQPWGPPGAGTSVYLRAGGPSASPAAGLGTVRRRDPALPRYFFTLMREW